MEPTLKLKDTKDICMCSGLSMFLIILFIISPLNNYFRTSLVMKIIIIIILIYTIYLNYKQILHFKSVKQNDNLALNAQININIICSYIFNVFLLMLIYYVIKSFL